MGESIARRWSGRNVHRQTQWVAARSEVVPATFGEDVKIKDFLPVVFFKNRGDLLILIHYDGC